MRERRLSAYLFLLASVVFAVAAFLAGQPYFYGFGVVFLILGVVLLVRSGGDAADRDEPRPR